MSCRAGDKLKTTTRLYLYRQMAGYTSSEFAQMLGISKSTYSQIENGWTIPKRALLEKIAQLLSRDPDELLIKVRV